MDHARIATLLEPFLGSEDVTPGAPTLFQNISTYIDILLRWNARINLTAVRGPEQIITRHFGESLFVARQLFPHTLSPAASVLAEGSCRLADLGSGAGFPGIPIKLWEPGISLALIESNHKKATFLREVARALTLTDINILNIRAEHLDPALHRSFQVVTLRAVERFVDILPAAVTLLAPSARLALLIGASQRDQARKILPQLSWSDPTAIPLSNSRILLIGQSPS
jgi:16S rRNA (guanine527-N7)-methyltransferase